MDLNFSVFATEVRIFRANNDVGPLFLYIRNFIIGFSTIALPEELHGSYQSDVLEFLSMSNGK